MQTSAAVGAPHRLWEVGLDPPRRVLTENPCASGSEITDVGL